MDNFVLDQDWHRIEESYNEVFEILKVQANLKKIKLEIKKEDELEDRLYFIDLNRV